MIQRAVLTGTNPSVIDMNPVGDSTPRWLARINNKLYFGTTGAVNQQLTVFDPSQATSVGTNPSVLSTIFDDTLDNMTGTTYSETVTE